MITRYRKWRDNRRMRKFLTRLVQRLHEELETTRTNQPEPEPEPEPWSTVPPRWEHIWPPLPPAPLPGPRTLDELRRDHGPQPGDPGMCQYPRRASVDDQGRNWI